MEVGVEGGLALVLGGVEDLEDLDEEGAGVGAVVAGAVAEEVGEGVALEDAGVVGEEAEDDAGEEQFEIAPGVAVGLQLVVEGGHALGGEAVDGFFFLVLARVLDEEGEAADVARQVFQREGDDGVRVEVAELEGGEVGDDDGLGEVVVRHGGEVVEGLELGGGEVASGRFLLGEELPGPEEVDEALLVAGFLDGVFEEGAVAAVIDAEDGEEFGPERLAVAFFVGFAGPAGGELLGTVLDLVPRVSWHPSPFLPLRSWWP